MFPIKKLKIPQETPDDYLLELKKNISPIKTSVNIITPVKVGKNTSKAFGGKMLPNGIIRMTRSKYFFMRWLPKLILDVKTKRDSIEVTIRPAILTTIMLVYFAFWILEGILNIIQGEI